MSLTELIETAEFVVDAQGNKKAVQLDLSVWQALLQRLAELEGKEADLHKEATAQDAWALDLCGIWEDQHSAEEIVENIISARTEGREVVL